MDSVKIGAVMPHPPLLIPAIGRESLKLVKATDSAAREIAKKIKKIEKGLDAIVIITPHGRVSRAAVPVYTGHVFEGSFSSFGFPEAKIQVKGCPELAIALVREAEDYAVRSPETVLDHGILVPLHYIIEEKIDLPVLPIAVGLLPLRQLFEFGRKIQTAAKKTKKRIAVIGSADMSHRLTKDAPSGYDPKGAEFDKKLVELVGKYDINEILDFPEELADSAGQDALWSIAILLGAMDGLKVRHKVLSYEGPFGVGYMVAAFQVMTNDQ